MLKERKWECDVKCALICNKGHSKSQNTILAHTLLPGTPLQNTWNKNCQVLEILKPFPNHFPLLKVMHSTCFQVYILTIFTLTNSDKKPTDVFQREWLQCHLLGRQNTYEVVWTISAFKQFYFFHTTSDCFHETKNNFSLSFSIFFLFLISIAHR